MAKKKKVREKVPYQKSALLAFRNGVRNCKSNTTSTYMNEGK